MSVRGGNPAPGVIRRHPLPTRIIRWLWAVCVFFLVSSGLQIFDAHPALYTGQQSGMAAGFDNSVLQIGAEDGQGGAPATGITEIFGRWLGTTGVLGLSGPADAREARAFPAWASTRWLQLNARRGQGRALDHATGPLEQCQVAAHGAIRTRGTTAPKTCARPLPSRTRRSACSSPVAA